MSQKTFEELAKTLDFTHIKDYRGGNGWNFDSIPSELRGTDWLFNIGQANGVFAQYDSSEHSVYLNNSESGMYIGSANLIPIQHTHVTSITFNFTGYPAYSQGIGIKLYGLENGNFIDREVDYAISTQTVNESITEDCDVDVDYIFVYSGLFNQQTKGAVWKNIIFNADASLTSNGGGATHIAKVTGQLKDLSSNLSDILMVSGGGGGGYLVGEDAYAGADAGGISGSGNNSGNQSSGYAFGQGESGTNESGGGSGLYGGTKNGTSSTIIMNSWCKTTDYNNHRQSSHRHNFTVNFNTDVVSELSSYLGSDYILEYLGDNPSGGMYSQVPITYDGDNNVFYSSVYNKHIALPIKSGIGKIVKLAFSYTNKSSGFYAWIQVGLLKINGSTTTTLKYAQYSSTGNYELTLDTPSEADYLWICNAEDLFEISNMTMYVQTSFMNEAGAGSGYIGNSLLSNKKMVGYNVPTSSAEGTKTESINEVSASAVSGKPKSGNGFARIKFLRKAWGGEEVAILWAGQNNRMTAQISNNKIVFKLYSGDLLTYSFDAYAGTTIIDADNIYVHFLIDSEQELAKPSMIYDNNSVLSYNQEEPTDEEMALIYTWLSAGLSSS